MSRIIREAFDLWRDCREDFDTYREAAYARAVDATNGALLNDRGRRAGIDGESLFMGPAVRALAYASPELVEHWQVFPRVTFDEFERQWMQAHEAEWRGAA
ncbi:hypothetical protein CSIV_14355 [Microbacterium sp. CSI-V]|uniref:hypothetical protein n=1 Tax=Microbacterium sp. CSI-V TaxID=1933777 RepID=UPI00097BB431|nr:hypothetical protein [Microbacterium sp. CSI-V]ONI62653.1 hypothetical protein CSIV_14355 [Microbacterium sp. CSI-V]